MKVRIILTIVVLASLTNLATANVKAMFIHGFGSDSLSWKEKGTHTQLLANTVIDQAVFFQYSVGSETFDDIATRLVTDVLAINNPGDKWILIGHSLGGLVARGVEPIIRSYGIGLEAVLTIATPHQGAMAAAVNENAAAALLGDWHTETSAGPLAGNHSAVSEILDILIDMGVDEAALVYDLPELLNMADEEATEWIELANGVDAVDLLGPLSEEIRNLNDDATITPYLSIIGAERSPTIMRWSSELEVFGTSGEYSETAFTQIYSGLILLYSTNKALFALQADILDWGCIQCITVEVFGFQTTWCPTPGVCNDQNAAETKRDKWNDGLLAWQNIDDTWSEAIGCGQTVSYTTEIWHPYTLDCSGRGGGGVESIKDGSYDFEAMLGLPVGCIGVPGWMETTTVSVYVGSKNDGLVQSNMALWRDTDTWAPNNLQTMLNQDNSYYSDTESNGGWNHSEMMRYTRIYDEPDAGTTLTPLKRNEGWIDDQLQ